VAVTVFLGREAALAVPWVEVHVYGRAPRPSHLRGQLVHPAPVQAAGVDHELALLPHAALVPAQPDLDQLARALQRELHTAARH
jgi:hypothetical protein